MSSNIIKHLTNLLHFHQFMTNSYKAITIFIFSFILLPVSAETTEELLTLANKAKQQSAYSTALIHLKNAVKQDPRDLKVRIQLADLFIFTGQGLQAEVEINKAIRLDAKPSDTSVLMAKAKYLQGEFESLTDNINILDLPQSQIARMRAIQGHAFFEQRKFEQAAQMFQRALLLAPDEVEVQLGQIKLFRMNKQIIQESDLARTLLQNNPENADILITAGNFYLLQNDFTKALELFTRAGLIQTSNVNVWFGITRSYIGKGDFKAAKNEIDKVLVNYPEHQVANYLLATIAYEERDYDRAKSAIQIVLKGQKRKFEALQLLSTIQFQLGEYSEAERNLDKFLKFHPNDVQALKTLAAVYLKRKQGVKALNALKKIEHLDDSYIYSMIATAYLTLGNKEKSEAYMQKSLDKDPENKVIQRHFLRSQLQAGESVDVEFTDSNFENYVELGHIPVLNLLRQKKYDEAIKIINGYMKKLPNNALMHYLLGSAYLYKDELETAQNELATSVKLDPKFSEARIYLAKTYQRSGNDRDAEREYREVLNFDKNNDQAMVALAGIFHRADNTEEMLKWLNRSRKTNSASLASREVLERHYREKGEMTNALKVSEEMVDIQPQNISLLKKLAVNQKLIGRLDLAIQTFSRIVKLHSEDPSALFGLGQLQYINSNYNDARVNFTKVLQYAPKNLTAKVILVEVDFKQKNFKSALKHAQELQKNHPKSPAGYDKLGDVHIALDKPAQAIEYYKKSVAIKYSSETYLKLYSSYNISNQEAKGRAEIQKWIKQYPKDFNLKEALAITYQRSQEFEKASELYQEIIQSVKKNDRILSNLALVSLKLHNPMSMEYADMAYNLNPEKASNKDTLGWVLYNNNQKKKGAELLKKAVEQAPGNSDIRYHYAVALADLGQKSQAINQLYLAINNPGSFDNRHEAQHLLDKLKK